MWLCLLVLLVTGYAAAAGSSDYRIENLQVEGQVGPPGSLSTLTCQAAPNNTLLWWEKNGVNITADARTHFKRTEDGTNAVLALSLLNTSPADMAVYTCRAVLSENRDIAASGTFQLNLTLEGKVVDRSDARAEEGADADLRCELQGFPLREVKWRIGKSGLSELLPQNVVTRRVNDSHVSTRLQFHRV